MDVRTWIEIDKKALHHNVEQFLRLIPKKTRFMAVVKSNAYGHGLVHVAKQLAEFRSSSLEFRGSSPNSKFKIQNSRIWFGVDSITEGLRLRKEGIKNHILVLGYTLPSRLEEAAAAGIAVTVSSPEALKALVRVGKRPVFHIKIDTGMHRQGFLPTQALDIIRQLKRNHLAPEGVFTHFAAAKDPAYPTYTLMQAEDFQRVVAAFRRTGYSRVIRHAAASGGTLLFPETHLDMVRIGIGIYGYWPSQEAKIGFTLLSSLRAPKGRGNPVRKTATVDYGIASSQPPRNDNAFELEPVLSWKAIVSEVKEISAGSYVGYDLTERVSRKTIIAVLPIGYWHGYDRGLSGVGEVLIRRRRAKVLGRISMDMTVVDATNIPRVCVGDTAILLGKDGEEEILADELSLRIGTTPYEVLTRINPLIRRVVI
ncbi:MAG: alanine racemase [Parcubacteria group bacterium Gr01-1014_66]|nr:MAG: alanine racemase [Parcubacteria group bacterium Gr01-1014_66]